MASNSLRISNTDANATINEEGYIAVVKKLILDPDGFEDFVGEDEDQEKFSKARTKMLRELAESKGGQLQQRDEDDQVEQVTRSNCRIRATPDKRKDSPKGFSKVTISLPEEPLSAADLNYIDDYIAKYIEIRTKRADGTFDALPNASSQDNAKRARMFVLGMMMLTRCR